MIIKPPQLKSAPYLLCDWLELKALSSPLGKFRLSTLRRIWDVNRETESSDPEGRERREEDTDIEGVGGGDDDVFMDSILDEFQEREAALGESYPFKLTGNSILRVVGPPSAGGYTYIFCLLLSHANSGDLLSGEWLPHIDNRVRDLFQACSTLAAAAEVQGCAISFGWPRPNDNPPFLRRLGEVYALFGEGVVVPGPRPGVSPCPKDEEIDVIAWRPRPDRSPGTHYLLGQVASGNNWSSKPIKGPPINNFHRNWFQPPPPSEATASIFIPHAVHPAGIEGTRRERMDAITLRYGIIIDRMRLPRLMQDGINLALEKRPGFLIERTDDIKSIETWVHEQLSTLHQATN